MFNWQPISTAPRDGTKIFIKTYNGYGFEAYYDRLGAMDEKENTVGQWVAAKEDVCPSCWSEGACWSSNADESPSDQPEFWLAPVEQPSRDSDDK